MNAASESKVIGTLKTNVSGAAISIGVGFAVASVSTTAFTLLSGLPVEEWWWLPSLIPGFAAGGAFFERGLRAEVPIGHVGVPTFLDERIKGKLLSEGRHWLFPWLYSFQIVNVQIKTLDASAQALSVDNVLMTGDGTLTYQVDDPETFLSTERAEEALLKYARTQYRNLISAEESEELERPEGKSKVCKELVKELKNEGERVGIKIIDFAIGEILPPEEISNAAAKKRKEEEEAKAEQKEVDNVIVMIDRLHAKGFSLEKAAEIVQTERSKANTNRNIVTLEGFEGIADTLSQGLGKALEAAMGGKK